jgi:hypothetical protein
VLGVDSEANRIIANFRITQLLAARLLLLYHLMKQAQLTDSTITPISFLLTQMSPDG